MNRRTFLISALAAAQSRESVDEFGGWTAHDLGASGRFRTAQWQGGHWLVTPKGHPLIVVGLCHSPMPPERLRVAGDPAGEKFGDDLARYAADVVAWMRGAGFNTFSYGVPEGAGQQMNRLSELTLVPGFINGPQFPDFYDSEWRSEAAEKIARLAPPASSDARAIGHVLSSPLLFSPSMERPRIWRNGKINRQNYLTAVKSLPDAAAGKRAYGDYMKRMGVRDIPAGNADELHPDDAGFYTEMWSRLTEYFVREIRRHDPKGIIFSYRFIRVLRWPDPWLEAMLRGVGPHVDAFAAELYADNPYREIVDGIGRLTGKPTLIADGMRLKEFVYAEEADDRHEAERYEEMFRSLLGSPWFLGGCVCEYRQKMPNNPYYSPRPEKGRIGLRNLDFSEREALLATFRFLHSDKYDRRVRLLRTSGNA